MERTNRFLTGFLYYGIRENATSPVRVTVPTFETAGPSLETRSRQRPLANSSARFFPFLLAKPWPHKLLIPKRRRLFFRMTLALLKKSKAPVQKKWRTSTKFRAAAVRPSAASTHPNANSASINPGSPVCCVVSLRNIYASRGITAATLSH